MELFSPEILKSPRWPIFRRAVIAEKGKACAQCGAVSAFPHVQILNVVLGQMPWEYKMDEVHVVCADCYYLSRSQIKNFFRLLGYFNQGEQHLFLEVARCVLSHPMHRRAVVAEHFAAIARRSRDCHSFEEILDLDEESIKVAAGLYGCDVSTIGALVDGLEAIVPLQWPLRTLTILDLAKELEKEKKRTE